MGARPADFDENVVKQSPTFQKWLSLEDGQKLRYACRDFIKGHNDDEERLMRRIMIARRNNLRDHEILKRARNAKVQAEDDDDFEGSKEKRKEAEVLPQDIPPPKKRRAVSTAYSMTDEEVRQEMDKPAVEATRSYKAWSELEDGKEFTYNQRYCKGKEGHDWLLKKNIWRRMRYRRENKKMVDKLKNEGNPQAAATTDQSALNAAAAAAATQIVDEALLAGASAVHGTAEKVEDDTAAVVEAAVAAVTAAESFISETMKSDSVETVPVGPVKSEAVAIVHNPIIDVPPVPEEEQPPLPEPVQHHTPNPLVEFGALDVAAKLAAAASAADPQIGDDNSQGQYNAPTAQV